MHGPVGLHLVLGALLRVQSATREGSASTTWFSLAVSLWRLRKPMMVLSCLVFGMGPGRPDVLADDGRPGGSVAAHLVVADRVGGVADDVAGLADALYTQPLFALTPGRVVAVGVGA